MSLPIHNCRMSEVAEAGMDAGGFPGGLCAVAGVLGSALHSGRIVARGLRGEPEDARVVDTGSAMRGTAKFAGKSSSPQSRAAGPGGCRRRLRDTRKCGPRNCG